MLGKSVAIGGRIAEIWVNPNIAAATERLLQAEQLLFDLSGAQLDQVLAETAAHLPEATMNLDVPLGDERVINGLLDRARQEIAALNVRVLQEARNLAVQSQRDPLTSLYNRAYLNQFLGVQCDLSRQLGHPLIVIFIDIDNFKSINDAYGHHCGDAVLVSVAQAIQSVTTENDTIVRYGGDEFLVLLTNTDETTGAVIAEGIRSEIEARHRTLSDEMHIPVTVSVGWTMMTAHSTIRSAHELLDVADRSLYLVKSDGRNRIARAG
jgi:diguanylate cyclase (GGDEF)-like protein